MLDIKNRDGAVLYIKHSYRQFIKYTKKETEKTKSETTKDKTQEQEREEMQIQGSMTLSGSNDTRITEREFFLIEQRLSLLLQHTIKTLIYAETSSYSPTKAPMKVDTKGKTKTSQRFLYRLKQHTMRYSISCRSQHNKLV